MLSSTILRLLFFLASGCLAQHKLRPTHNYEDHPTATGHAHPRIYIASLPEKYNIQLVYGTQGECNYDLEYAERVQAQPWGTEAPTISVKNVFGTEQLNLEVYWHTQLLHSPLRTGSLEDADLVFVPFYVALRSYDQSQHFCRREDLQKLIDEFWEEADVLMPHLRSKPHLIALGDLEVTLMRDCNGFYWPEYYSFLCHPRASELIVLVPEPYTNEQQLTHNNMYYFHGPVPIHPNTLGVPWFGHVHLHTVHEHSVLEDHEAILRGKDVVASGVFSFASAAGFRHKLAQDCGSRPDLCVHFDPHDRSMEELLSGTFDAYRRAWYCLMPFGDTPFRQAFYDCVASGAGIPVVFDAFYTDMLPFSWLINYTEFVVHIPLAQATDPAVNVIDLLQRLEGEQQREERLRAVQDAAHALQYALRPSHELVHFGYVNTVHSTDDAFTLSLKAVLRHACRNGSLPLARCQG